MNIEGELKAFDQDQKNKDLSSNNKDHSSGDNLWFHLDIMDGHFVPNLTFGPPILKQLAPLAKHPLDAHFMVSNPLLYVEACKEFNIHNFTFHFESVVHHDSLIRNIKKYYPSVGMAINPSTSIDVIPDYILSMLDLVLIMSVNPGFGGQKFIDYTYQKVEALNQRRTQLQKVASKSTSKLSSSGSNPETQTFQIQIDGGIEEKEAQKLIKLGADNLVAGTYIFNSYPQSYMQKVESLR